MRQHLRIVRALMRRALNEILRVPAGAIPGVLAPTIFMLGLSSVFAAAARLRGYHADFRTFVVPVGFLQGAGFSGAATGVNLARDIEQGWFDRLLLAPAPRSVLLTGIVASASMRALLPATMLLTVALILGVHSPGIVGLLLAAGLVMTLAAAAACWGVTIALRFRTQQAAPLMQIGSFVAVLFTTAYAPHRLLSGWLQTVSDANPVTYVLEGVRQGFVGSVTWTHTWHAMLAATGVLAFFALFAVRGMRRTGAE
ncbi:MAG TPA: ABC transporter permease [Solirubrobacteraceae bacterium]|jgi:ABC-2 type transport system permease protein